MLRYDDADMARVGILNDLDLFGTSPNPDPICVEDKKNLRSKRVPLRLPRVAAAMANA